MSKKRLVIHIGYPKTGTTTLQVNVLHGLHREKQLRLLGNSELTNDPEVVAVDRFIRSVLYKKEYGFDLHRRLASNCTYLSGLLDEHLVNVFSSEYLTIPDRKPYELDAIPGMLREAFGTADIEYDIVITLREQASLVYSYFAHFFEPLFYGDPLLSDVNRWVEQVVLNDETETSRVFDFERTARIWSNEFGKDRIFFNIFEQMQTDLPGFLQPWANLTGQPVNEIQALFQGSRPKRVGQKSQDVYFSNIGYDRVLDKYLDRLTSGTKTGPDRGRLRRILRRVLQTLPKKRIRLTTLNEKSISLIREKFSNSNERLAQLYNIDSRILRGFNYF